MPGPENENIFLPRPFSEGPMCQTSAPSVSADCNLLKDSAPGTRTRRAFRGAPRRACPAPCCRLQITQVRTASAGSGRECNADSRFMLQHSLAAVIAPRRRQKPARHQFSLLGRNGLSDNIQFCNPPSRTNPVAGPYRAYLPARWKGKAYTSTMNVSLKVVGRRSPRWIAEPPESSEARFAQSTFHSGMLDAACGLAPYGRCGRFASIVHTAPQLITCIACRVGRCFSKKADSQTLQSISLAKLPADRYSKNRRSC